MNILKSINASFTKFWRWIKETAWVQPLLIVGAIFAIIFSISKFTNWFGTMASGGSASYFTNFRASLENEGKDGIDTDADKLTLAIQKITFGNYGSYADAEEAMKADNIINAYGKKFFFLFVESECDGCTKAENAFKILEDNWGTGVWTMDDSEPFKVQAIFADEISTNDSTFDLEDDQVAFYRYATRFYENDFWSLAASQLEEAPYKENKSVDDKKYESLATGEASNWETPTIFLVDFTEEAYNAGRFGLSEVLFGFTSGDSDYARATILQNMWNHIGKEGSFNNDNPFRADYVK